VSQEIPVTLVPDYPYTFDALFAYNIYTNTLSTSIEKGDGSFPKEGEVDRVFVTLTLTLSLVYGPETWVTGVRRHR
jgi:hypothetical protein